MASSQVFLSDLKSGCFVSGRRGMLGAELRSVDMFLLDSKKIYSVSGLNYVAQKVICNVASNIPTSRGLKHVYGYVRDHL
ncbi:hypothetical protein DY000_02027158 [Brassica cretica]|uniref:Uncharacterized protein n=1 Tax=Brassica cretica TaxID=69181 RepID=A0ABQ7EG06_BRACR|nr:hypothetical protein DY000_02027158 [Brassica cretica]